MKWRVAWIERSEIRERWCGFFTAAPGFRCAQPGLRSFSEQLGANLPKTFPVIDKWLDGVATSIKSIDLNAATYQDAARLTYRPNSYVDKVATFEEGSLGDIDIEASAITGRVLSVAVPKGSMTQIQRSAIEAARTRAQAFDVDLIVTEF